MARLEYDERERESKRGKRERERKRISLLEVDLADDGGWGLGYSSSTCYLSLVHPSTHPHPPTPPHTTPNFPPRDESLSGDDMAGAPASSRSSFAVTSLNA